jgi:hypothetical protein
MLNILGAFQFFYMLFDLHATGAEPKIWGLDGSTGILL